MAKIKLIQVENNSFYCSGRLSVGVYLCPDNSAILFDSGLDKGNAKAIEQALQEKNFSVKAIINTHCHGDHCGGNYYFQDKYTDLRVYATEAEKNSIEDPEHAPRCFCCNAAPIKELLKAKAVTPQASSRVTDLISPYNDQVINIDGIDFEIVTLPGHTPGSIGIISPDRVFYTGDAVFGPETYNKHKILYYTDITKTLASFDKLLTLENTQHTVLYHGGKIENLNEIVAIHKDRILRIREQVMNHLQEKLMSIDELTQQIMCEEKLPNNVVSFTLTQTVLRAYISHLQALNQLSFSVKDGLMCIAAEPVEKIHKMVPQL